MNIFERRVAGRRYRIASQSLWDSARQRPFARQAVLGPADVPPMADLALTRTVGTRRVGDLGALIWVAEQLDLIKLIDQACALRRPTDGPTVGEMVLAVAVQRACAPAAKCHLAAFLESSVPRVSCLPVAAFTGQTFHRLAAQVKEEQLENAQIEIARAAVQHFELSADVLAFDTTNFDTHIATTTPGELARRGHAKSKRSDLRVVGLATLVSETGHVPLETAHVQKIPYALTGGPAADAVQHFYRGPDVPLFLDLAEPGILRTLRLLPDRTGPVVVLKPFGAMVYWKEFGGMMVAPPWLVYAELLTGDDPRAREAAEEFRRGLLQ